MECKWNETEAPEEATNAVKAVWIAEMDMEPTTRLELVTCRLRIGCSTN
jgi:hypothetical protein